MTTTDTLCNGCEADNYDYCTGCQQDEIRWVPTDYRRLASGNYALLASDGHVIEIVKSGEVDDQWLDFIGENCCYTCDGMGHGYIIGWHEVDGKGTQPVLSGPCTIYNT